MISIKKVTILLFCLILVSISACAVSEPYYTHFQFDKFGGGQAGFQSGVDVVNWLNTNITYATTDTITGGYTTVVVGNVDDDGNTEFVYNDNNTLIIGSYDEDSDTFSSEYSTSTIDVHSQIVLFDGDSDGKHEIYFCGIEDSVGNSTFFAYEVESGTLSQKWSQQVANGVSSPDSESHMGCGHVDTASGVHMKNANSLYAPACTSTTGDANKYCVFVGACNDAACSTRRNNFMSIYRFNADTGARTVLDVVADVPSGTECRTHGAGGMFFSPMGHVSNAMINGDEKNVVVPLCDIDGDSIDEIFIVGHCQDPSTSDYDFVGLLVDLDTMQENTAFDSDGVQVIDTSSGQGYSSPACFNRGDGFRFFITDTTHDTLDLQADGSLTLTINGVGTYDENTNQMFGEFNADANIDVLTISYDDSGSKTFTFGGGNIAGLVTDGIAWNVVHTGSNRNLRSSAIAASESQSGELGGTSDDDVFFNFGIYEGNDTDESFADFLYSPGYINGQPVMGDLNFDGFADYIVRTSTGLNIYIANSSVTNSQVDFKQLIPDVRGRPICTGNNQSFFIDSPNGYEDLESNNVRTMISCINNGTYINSSFVAHGTTFDSDNAENNCFFNETGSFISRVCMQDNLHESDFSQCINVETIVTSAEGCEDPDDIYDVADIVEDDEEADDDADEDAITPITEDLEDNIDTIMAWVGATSQNTLDMVFGVLIIILMIAVGLTPIPHAWIISMAAGLMALTISTVVGFVRPVYLVVLIVLMLFLMFVIRPLISSRGD